jgi:hypothetical protein
MIFFFVMRRRGTMRMCGEFVKFSGSLMCVSWHALLSPHH